MLEVQIQQIYFTIDAENKIGFSNLNIFLLNTKYLMIKNTIFEKYKKNLTFNLITIRHIICRRWKSLALLLVGLFLAKAKWKSQSILSSLVILIRNYELNIVRSIVIVRLFTFFHKPFRDFLWFKIKNPEWYYSGFLFPYFKF